MTGNELNLSTYSSTDSELELISMLAGNSKYFPEIESILSASDFYFLSARKCFSHMQELYGSKGEYIIEDVILWAKDNIDGSDWNDIKKAVREVSTFSLDSAILRAREIKRYSILRAVRKAAGKLLEARADNVTDEAEAAVQELNALYMGNIRNEPKAVSDLLVDYTNRLYSGDNKNILQSGYENFDRMLQMSRSDLIVAAARPGVGKSAFAISLGLKFAYKGYKTTLFSLEMDETQVLNRAFACLGQIPLDILKNKRMNGSGYENTCGSVSSALFTKPFSIQSEPNITVTDIKRACRRNKSDVIIVDYLQLLTPQTVRKNANRAEEVGEMTRQLKIMAKELNALVIVLSQLNRETNKRAIPRPILSDLRESGSIEQDANAVILLSTVNPNDNNSDVLVDIAKNRDGMTGTLIYSYNRSTQTLRETDRKYVPQNSGGKKERNIWVS